MSGISFAALADAVAGPALARSARAPIQKGSPTAARARSTLEALLATMRLQAPASPGSDAGSASDAPPRRRGSGSSHGSSGRCHSAPLPAALAGAGAPGSCKALSLGVWDAAAVRAARASADGSPAQPRTPLARPPPRPARAAGSPRQLAYASPSPRAPVGVVASRWRSGEPVSFSSGASSPGGASAPAPMRTKPGAKAAQPAARCGARRALGALRSFRLPDFRCDEAEDC
jgi:hypothetical protein